jgi:hypothetical protein
MQKKNNSTYILGFLLAVLPLVSVKADWRDRSASAINSAANPGAVNPHYNSGGRRMVRINGVTLALAPESSGEKIYRSDNNGTSWEPIDSNPTFSGCLISGAEEYVYNFYISGDNIYMVKFKYNESPPAAVSIYNAATVSETGTGAYRAVNAIVDETGTLYVAAHWGSTDQIYILRSDDGGLSWDGPFALSTGSGPWYYQHLEVNTENVLVAVYDNFDASQITFAKSFNRGETWQRIIIAQENPTSNPSILTVGTDDIFVFTQSGVSGRVGLVYNHSSNLGDSWDGWRVIDPTCGYADPSPALGSDGTIYVAFRSNNGSGLTAGSCGDQCKSRLAMSSNGGDTWTFPDDNYAYPERVGTRNQIRYQTWFNYGGPLEWIWMQYTNSGSQHPIYYDINTDITIYNSQQDLQQMRSKIETDIKEYKNNPNPQNNQQIKQSINDYLKSVN